VNLAVDIGGTFTDLAAFDPAGGHLLVAKALNRAGHGEGGLRDALSAAGLPPAGISEMTHATTVITNLLVERRGAEVGLICSRGFRDVLEMRLSFRERTFDLSYEKTPPLVPRRRRVEIGGRITASGEEREPIDEGEVASVVRGLVADGVESLAIALYNAYANDEHEHRVAQIARAVAPDLPISVSTAVDSRIGEYERASTVVLNASAVPTMEQYVEDLGRVVQKPIRFMHSGGGVVPATEARARPIQLAFSGPAAGVLAGRQVARDLGFENAITMDMGGTTCDVCLIWDDELRSRDSFDVEWDVPARVRSLDVHSVGAGGGSIAWRDAGHALRVGPRSARAVPGPACYGHGGEEPTVTDANLVLGVISPAGLLGGDLPLDGEAASEALRGLADDFDTSIEELARAIWAMSNANMTQAIREITVRRGIDPRSCVLIAFGGAGPQHAAGVAAELGIRHFAVPSQASVLSTLGLLGASLETSSARTVLADLGAFDAGQLEATFEVLARDAVTRLGLATDGELVTRRFGGMRYVGQSHEVAIGLDPDPEPVAERFAREHERLYGTRLADPVEIVDVWVTVSRPRVLGPDPARSAASPPRSAGERDLRLVDAVVPVYERDGLAGETNGPCLVEETNSVTYVPAGATVVVRAGHLLVELS
jgi:N-methylhydantoinase A